MIVFKSYKEKIQHYHQKGLQKLTRQKILLETFIATSKNKDVKENLHEDVNSSDSEVDSQHFLAIIGECLALLGKLPEAVETIKRRMQKELAVIIQKKGIS